MDVEKLRGLLSARLPSGTPVDLYDSGAAFLASEAKHDLVFLDILMDGMNGVETARRLRKRDISCLIVFLTTSREFAWEAFPVHPFDYLIKPVDVEKLDRVLAEAERVLRRGERMLSVKVGRQTRAFPVSALRYAYARDHFLYITLTDGQELKCYMTFAEALAMLSAEPRFLVCNRGVLINMDEVRAFDGECFAMKDGQTFPVRLHRQLQTGKPRHLDIAENDVDIAAIENVLCLQAVGGYLDAGYANRLPGQRSQPIANGVFIVGYQKRKLIILHRFYPRSFCAKRCNSSSVARASAPLKISRQALLYSLPRAEPTTRSNHGVCSASWLTV